MTKKKVVIRGSSADGQSFMHEVSHKPDEFGAYGCIVIEKSRILGTQLTYFIEKDTKLNGDQYFIDLTNPR
ncbi:hypothetical protein I5380_07455 [Citrobacter koseri]|uniref:hypothetical protein n=1 Tax=Citrobacter koseri TaxID=545 RepID=UPI001904CF3A|nr:hypothetical protein [Citrobacter koseri]MBJ8805535.1 hypothetical protein [Citrobacter koseri]